MALDVYRRKRKFEVTSEPRGSTARKKGNSFVIQKHAARRLHYDLRLELDGVMKSWAVTRGPSLDPNDKRLAVEVEDHPIEYNSFEGTIPQGEYGGGTVLIWDRGTWDPESDPHRGLQKGHLDFRLDGEKLHGHWHLVRMQKRRGESKTPWLLIKGKDEYARGSSDPDILEEEPTSVVSGRTIPEIAEGKGKQRVWHSNRSPDSNVQAGATRAAAPARKSARSPRRAASTVGRTGKSANAKKNTKKKKSTRDSDGGARLPDFMPPSLATLRAQPPSGADWVHEIKFDGYRIQARLERGDVRLLTRKGLDWADKFPNIAQGVAKLPADTALIDGEIAVLDDRGISNFSALQAALKAGASGSFVYYVFDLLHLDGDDLSALPLLERKERLHRLVGSDNGDIRYSEHFDVDGALMLREAKKMRLEGIVSKRKSEPYVSGRTEAFVKIKVSDAQEFVVGGYSLSTAMPNAIGALVLGYYRDGRFVYAGRVGTGYTHQTARALWKRLQALAIDDVPFDEIPAAERRRRDIVWVAPRTVVEAEFRGWTTDSLLRQASFKGVREDKPAREVVREVAMVEPDDDTTDFPASGETKTAAEAAKVMARKSKPPARAKGPGAANNARAAAQQNGGVRFTHPDRIYWADAGVTKQDLADYYRGAWDWMAPHLVGRPLSFLRCPDGISGQCFFQKHASAGLDETYLLSAIDKKRRQILGVDRLEGLLSLVQAGVLEVHVRGSRMDALDLCDRIVFDLDPGDGVAWPTLVAAARDVRERLAGIKLESFVKLSGGKGLHVVLPVAGVDWDTAKTFAQAVAMAMAADDPKRYVSKMTKSLRDGRIFIDYFRNSLEQTSIAAYSTRARAGAPVSVPVTWEELARSKSSNQYTVLNLQKRLRSLKDDPWRDMTRVRQKLPDARQLRGER